MFLEVTLDDDTVALTTVHPGFTLQVLGMNGDVVASYDFGGLAAAELKTGDLQLAPAPAPEPAPTETETDAPPADPSADEPDTSGHDQAVADAQATVETATAVASDPALPTPEVVDHLAAALADVNAALVVFPDSSELADAKAQLDDLAAQVTPTK